MTHHVAGRIRNFRPTVFAEMSELSNAHGSVNLRQGFPDFPGPDFVLDAAVQAIGRGANQYAHPAGVPRLRQAIADDWTRRFALDVNPMTDVCITSGATEAIFDAVMAMIDPGDQVIVFEPFYDSYPASVTMAGGTMKVVTLRPPDWTFVESELEAAITPRTRLILVNTPHNPTGKMFSRRELDVIARLAIRHDLVVITDEVYDRIVFDGAHHIPIATLPGMWDRTLTINSTGKTFSLTGWKIGYAIGPGHLVGALLAVHQWVTFASATPFQEAMADALGAAHTNGYSHHLRAAYAARRNVLADHLVAAGLAPLPVQGSYFLLSPIDHLPFPTDVSFCRWMIETVGIASIPASAFYERPRTAPQMARFCFAKQATTLEEAGRRLSTMQSHLAALR